MLVFQWCQKNNFMKLTWEQQRFFSKMVKRDIDKIVAEHGVSEQEAYYWYTHGLYGGDRELEFVIQQSV